MASCLEKWFLYDVKSGFCISFSPHMKCHLEFNEGTKIQHREKLLPIKKKKTDLESPYSPATQVSGRTAGAEAEHIKCRVHPLLHRAKKQKQKKKHSHIPYRFHSQAGALRRAEN